MRRVRSYILVAFALVGCGGSGSDGPTCSAPQTLRVVGYTTGSDPIVFPLPMDSGPFPADADALYFSEVGGPPTTTNGGGPPTFTGTPVLTGSNGTTIVGGTLGSIENTDTIIDLYGYASSISGLVPNVTYAVSFPTLRWDQTGCTYGAQSAGSFSTD